MMKLYCTVLYNPAAGVIGINQADTKSIESLWNIIDRSGRRYDVGMLGVKQESLVVMVAQCLFPRDQTTMPIQRSLTVFPFLLPIPALCD